MPTGSMMGSPSASMFGGKLDSPWAKLAMTLGPALMAYGFQQPGLAQLGPQMLGMEQRSKERAAETAAEQAEAERQQALASQVAGMFGAPTGGSAGGMLASADPGAPPPGAPPGMMADPTMASLPPPAAGPGMFDALTPEQQQIAQTMAATDPMAALEYAGGLIEPQDSASRIGRLQDDLTAGRITPEQYQVGVSAMNRPLVQTAAGETAEAREVGTWYGKQFTGLQDAASEARAQNARLDQMSELMEQTYTGAGAEQVLAAKRLGQMLGMDMEGVGEAEAGRALASEMALQLRSPAGGAGMPGAMSDKDREFLVAMTPNISMTPEGRRMLIEIRKRTNERSIEVARMARDYRGDNQRLDAGFSDMLDEKYRDTNMFSDLAPAAGPTTETPAPGPRLRFDAEGNIIQ